MQRNTYKTGDRIENYTHNQENKKFLVGKGALKSNTENKLSNIIFPQINNVNNTYKSCVFFLKDKVPQTEVCCFVRGLVTL